MENILFYILSFIGAMSSVGVIAFRNPMFSSLSLLVCVIDIGFLFALMNASFLFMAQLIIYAGAILTLLLFVLMFLKIRDEDLPKEDNKFKIMFFGAIVMLPLNLIVIKALDAYINPAKEIVFDGGIKEFGIRLYYDYLLPFELVSILLLVALIGAIVLAKKMPKRESK